MSASALLTTEETAERLRTPAGTLRYWRHIGYGPKGIKVGKRVLYKQDDVDAWLESLGALAG
ncbi:MAG: helix-turn-helix transcriptional regulator [Actinomycetes bacterium]